MSWSKTATSWNGDIYTYTQSGTGNWTYRHKTNPAPGVVVAIHAGTWSRQAKSYVKDTSWKWVHSGTGEVA
jgi:hypothetical protein